MPQTCTLATPNIIISSFFLLSVLLLLFPTLKSAIKEDLVDTKDERTHLYTHCHAFGGDVCVMLSTLVRLFSKLPTLRGAQVQVFFLGGRINTNCRHFCTPNGGIATKQAYINVSGGVTCHVTVQQVSVKLHVSVEQEVAVFFFFSFFPFASCCVFYAATFTRAVVLCTHL